MNGMALDACCTSHNGQFGYPNTSNCLPAVNRLVNHKRAHREGKRNGNEQAMAPDVLKKEAQTR
jgi:hypothetical protein